MGRCIATVLIDTGMRPEENSRLRWESVNWSNGHCGTLQVTHGKTAAARRMLPLSPRVRALLERRWEAGKMPAEGWVWATATASGHIEPSTVKKQHQRALRLSGVRPFVLYTLRAYFPDATRRSGLRCLDAGADCGPLINCHVRPVRSSKRRRRNECVLAFE